MGAATETRARHGAAAPDVQDDDRGVPIHVAVHDKERTATHLGQEFLLMVTVSDARVGADSLVLDNIVHHASPELMNVLRDKYDPTQSDYLCHAKELAHFAQSIELGGEPFGREVITEHVDIKRQDTRTCFRSGRAGHVVSNFKTRVVFDDESSNTSGSGDMVLALTEKSSKVRTKGV